MPHSSKEIIGTSGDQLAGKTILICLTGSVAIMKSPETARELMRLGAEVKVVMTPAACDLIDPNLMEWSTGNPVLTQLSGKLEHVAFVRPGDERVDLVLVAPATANTLNKIANGIADTAVTTTVYAAIGAGIPVLVAPAMHEPMLKHPVYERSVERLRTLRVGVVEPTIEEGKAKMAEVEGIIEAVVRRLYPKDMAGLKVLVTAGPTVEYVDPVRVVTNRSSGKMGLAIAREAFRRGADVAVVYGAGTEPVPTGAKIIRAETTSEMHQAVATEVRDSGCDLFVGAGAPSDYMAERTLDSKISSRESPRLDITLVATEKVMDVVREGSDETFVVAFKAEHGLSDKALVEKAYEWMKESGADLVAANDIGRRDVGFGVDTNEIFVIDREKNVTHLARTAKEEIARKLLDIALRKMRKMEGQE
ncbi:MAG: bifunctional phosphopantothenoylcysteine decarboxylase/phosphopantothenate--cysteine ligase CoaBC [Candidatus Geothermarchaeales archaeon]